MNWSISIPPQHIRLPEGAYDMLGTIHGIYDESVVGTALEQKPESPGSQKEKVVYAKEKKRGSCLGWRAARQQSLI